MWCDGELEDLVDGEAELVVFGEELEVWTHHAHTESVIGRMGRGATNRADGVWEGRGVGIVRITRRKGSHMRSGVKEILIPRVRDRISERISRNILGHCKGEGMMFWRGALCIIYTKVLCLRRNSEGLKMELQPAAGSRVGPTVGLSILVNR